MEITKETFIDILGLVEWDDKVLDVLEYLEVERPYISGEEFGCERISEKYGLSLYFSINTYSGTKHKREQDGSLYLSQIAWEPDTTLALPFGINYSDNCESIVQKVGRVSDIPEKFFNNSCGWGDYEKPYWLSCKFTDENMQTLQQVFIRLQQPYDFTKEW